MDKLTREDKNLDNSFFHLFIAATTKLSKEEGDEFIKYWTSKDEHELCLLVDDKYKLSIKKVMEEWDKQLDSLIKSEAQKLIDNKMYDIWEEVEDFTNELKDTLKTLLDKANATEKK